MKKIITVAFLLIQALGYAQYNLVPNPSFETYTMCPTGMAQMYNALPWQNTTAQTCKSPDFFHQCSSAWTASVPTNGCGQEPARTGVAYAGFYSLDYASASYSEYIEVELIDTLDNDKDYVVSFYVSLADEMQYATNNIGAYFSDTLVIDNSCDSLLPFIPQIINSNNSLISKMGWTLVTDTFTAEGGEKFMIIGNFFQASQSDTVYVGGNGWGVGASYYYMDDVSVIPLDSLMTGISSNQANNRFHLYPNPSNGVFIFDYTVKQDAELFVYDPAGRLVHVSALSANQDRVELNLLHLAKGMYLYSVKDKQAGMIRRGRILIQ